MSLEGVGAEGEREVKWGRVSVVSLSGVLFFCWGCEEKGVNL